MTLNEIRVLYDKYKGFKVTRKDNTKITGIIAGHNGCLLVARDNKIGHANWETMSNGCEREGHSPGDHYFLVWDIEDYIITPIIPPTLESLGEKYINDHFSQLDDVTKQKYIDIFIMGCNYKTK